MSDREPASSGSGRRNSGKRRRLKYVLHVGAHKTGTSYIQSECAERREELEAAGVYYPDTWRSRLGGHDAMSHQLRQGHYEFFRQNFEKFLIEPRSATSIAIFSNENLEDLPEDAIRELSDIFPPVDTTVVYYARNWPGLLASRWQERIKEGNFSTLPEYALGHAYNPRESEVLNYNLVLSRYAKFFGSENVVVRSYDNLIYLGNDVFEDLISVALGTESPLRGRRFQKNRSFASFETEVLRLMNLMILKEGDQPTYRVLHGYLTIKKNAAGLLAELEHLAAPHYRSLEVPQWSEALGRIEEDVFANYSNVGPIISKGRLFSDDTRASPSYCASSFLLESQAQSLLRELLNAFIDIEDHKQTAASEQTSNIPSSQQMPIVGGMRQAAPPTGIFDDFWVMKAANIKLLAEESGEGISLVGYIPEYFPNVDRNLEIVLNESKFGFRVSAGGQFRFHCPLSIAPGTMLNIKLSCDVDFNPAKSGISPDERNLCYRLVALELTPKG